jgi:hypothetical protein
MTLRSEIWDLLSGRGGGFLFALLSTENGGRSTQLYFFIKLIPESEFSTLFLSLCGLSEGVWGCKYGINKK